MAKARDAKTVIDTAIADNLWWEQLCYGLIVVFVVVGIAIVIVGAAQDNGLVSLSGTGLAGLFWPAIRYVWKFRSENIRVRLYELPLAAAGSADEMAAILREVYDRPPKPGAKGS